ncbi:MAG: Gfo/Idh/MocA family oxidoreductase, partial [Actinobacteria bacterium]|nr:Gfo/Idh/MocA family oxidoreductase [Actinomycetota bacterium]
LDQVVSMADAASVVVPSSLHAEAAVPLLEAGVHCLIEKPFVTTEADGVAVLDAAASSGARVLVGHIERFNPAVRQLREILAGEHDILAVDARRMSAVSARITDVDVVTDLMVHDLDIIVDLIDRPVVDLTARAVHRSGTAGDDYVSALLTFEGGAIASLTASRITQNRVRELQVTTDSRFFALDYANQDLFIYRQGHLGALGAEMDAGQYVLDVGTEQVLLRRTEPLVAELSHFVDVARGVAEPIVTAAHGLEMMRLVWQIHAAVRKGEVGD